MNWMRFGSRGGSGGVPARLAPAASLSLVAALLVLATAVPHAHAQQSSSNAGWRDVNLAEYRQHLEDLDSVVADCQAQLKLKKPAPANNNACDPNRVGPNDRVQGQGAAGSEPREVRYDWLRAVLTLAGSKVGAAQPAVARAPANAKGPPADPNELLNDAHQRLQTDERQAEEHARSQSRFRKSRLYCPAKVARHHSGPARIPGRDQGFGQGPRPGMARKPARQNRDEARGNGGACALGCPIAGGLAAGRNLHRAGLVFHPPRAQRAGALDSRRRARAGSAFITRMAGVDEGRAGCGSKRFVA